MVHSAPGIAASDDAYQSVFIEHLEMGPATYLNIDAHGKTAADIDKRLTELYHGNGLQPFWIVDGKPGPRAAETLAVLEDAESQGLVPNDYLVDKIHQYWDSKDTTGLVRLDILLTLGMMRYVVDQREGRMEPHKVDAKLFATARDVDVDWDALRKTAFEAPDMKAFLEQQAPPFPQYGQLRKKLAEYRAIAAKGGWPSIPAGETLKPGMDDQRVTMVRKRLAVTGDLASGNMDGAVFDTALEEAVKRFQKRHNLTPDGDGRQADAGRHECDGGIQDRTDCSQHGTLSLAETGTHGRAPGSGQYCGFRSGRRQAGKIRREDACDRRQNIPRNAGFQRHDQVCGLQSLLEPDAQHRQQ